MAGSPAVLARRLVGVGNSSPSNCSGAPRRGVNLPTLSVGLRQASVHELAFRRLTPAARMTEFLNAIEAGALFGTKELERLTLARELMERRLVHRRASSHLPQLIALFLSAPQVTASLAAKTLGISSQAARGLIGELAGSVREMTDRRRYRAWSIR